MVANRKLEICWPWLGLVLLMFFLGAGAWVFAAPSDGVQAAVIIGVVTDPAGNLPPAGTIVRLASPDGVTHGQAQVSPDDGTFSLGPVANGNYILQASAPAGSAYTPSVPQSLLVLGEPVDAGTLALTEPTVLGTVYAPDGVTPVTAAVEVERNGHLVQTSLAESGNIRLGGLLTGTYSLRANRVGDDPYWPSSFTPITVTATTTQSVALVLRPANVVGTVTDPQGVPVPGATIHVYGLALHVYRQDKSSPGGYFAIGDLPADDYLAVVEPPWWADSLIAAEPIAFSVPPALTDLGAVALRDAPKVLRGQVVSNVGDPVENAHVIANRLDHPGRGETLTNATGQYELRLGGGLWSVTVEPTPAANPGQWLYTDPPRLAFFHYNLALEQRTINFEVLTADATVVGSVVMPGGGPPPFTVTVSLRNNEGVGRTVLANPADGSFAVAVPHGNYRLFVQAEDPAFAGPPPQFLYVPVEDTLDVGEVMLLERDATISGVVVDSGGQGVGNVRLLAWTSDYLGAQTETSPDGSFALAVPAGTWLLRPDVPPEMAYIFGGEAISVTIGSTQTITGVDFILTDAPNMVLGRLVDSDGAPVGAYGTATAVGPAGPVNSAPIAGGSFALYLPDGDYQVGVTLSPGSDWLAGGPQPVSVLGGEVVELLVPLLPQDATIAGALWDPRQNVIPTGVEGYVMASNPWAGVGDQLDPANGTYRLGVSAGLWHLAYFVDPQSGYVVLDHHTAVPAESGQTVVVPLPVVQRDGVVLGRVLDPAGEPLAGATVAVEGLGRVLEQVTLRTTSDADGAFRLVVPHGVYRLRAAARPEEWLNPVIETVVVPRGGVVGGQVLAFRAPDVTLSGTVSLAGEAGQNGRVVIWAYTEDGAATHTTALLGESYSLPLLSGRDWTVGAVLETDHSFFATRTTFFVAGNADLDLLLNGPFAKPGPVSVSFAANEAQSLQLADGTRIFIPAGAMPVTGMVTLHITPIATFAHQHHARLYKYGYAFIATDEQGTPIMANFDQNVVITFAYDEAALVALNLREEGLRPAYFSTTTNSWTIPDSYVVDTEANRVTMQIDHFTDFSLLGGSQVYEVMLPTIVR